MSKEAKIGFVGLGRMGANMARHLKDCGYRIAAVYDSDVEKAKSLAGEINAQAPTKLSEVTAAADIIFTVVTDDQAMRKIFAASADNLLINAVDKIFVNCATITPDVHREVEQLADKVGAHSIEACMASSIPQARNGELFLIVGGNKNIVDKAKPILEDLSKSLTYVGPTGQAAEVKALVNMLMNINTAALAESLALGQALGLDLQKLCEVFAQTGANSRVLETDAADMLDRDHECYFSAEHAAKDSGIALTLAQRKGLELPLASATKKQYDTMVEQGFGELDKSGIAELTFADRGKQACQA